jgi:hypothetical protein
MREARRSLGHASPGPHRPRPVGAAARDDGRSERGLIDGGARACTCAWRKRAQREHRQRNDLRARRRRRRARVQPLGSTFGEPPPGSLPAAAKDGQHMDQDRSARSAIETRDQPRPRRAQSKAGTRPPELHGKTLEELAFEDGARSGHDVSRCVDERLASR